MKKRIVGIAGILVLMAGAAIASAETGTVTVTGDVLSVTTASISFTGVTLDGTDQVTTSTSNAWEVEDARGTGLGWHSTIASTDYTTDTVQRVENDATGGDFTLTYDGETTGAIPYNETAVNVETAIEALSNVTTVTVTGTGVAATPWVIFFNSATGQNIMTADDTGLTGQTLGTTIVLETIDISVADQKFGITLADADITIIAGNTKPTSSVTTLTDIADATLTYISAATDTGMGSYAIDPDFDLEVRAEVYEGTYVATVTLTNVSGP
jgi:hypothetical protein